MDGYLLGDLAEAAGVNRQTIRYYERRGLLPTPPRTRAGYRAFPPDALGRLRFIRQAQALGFTLEEIRGLLDLRVRPGVDCAEVRGRSRAKLEAVRAKIASLQAIESALSGLVRRCRGRGPLSDCPILDALDSGLASPRGSGPREP